MFKKIMNAFTGYMADYADQCARNSVYNVYVDLVQDRMNENER